MAGVSATGSKVDVGDSVSVIGEVVSISGTGPTATLTIRCVDGTTTTAQARDCFAPQGIGAAISENGKPFGLGSPVTLKCTVSSVSGSGSNAVLTVKTNTSSTVAVAPSKGVHAPKSH